MGFLGILSGRKRAPAEKGVQAQKVSLTTAESGPWLEAEVSARFIEASRRAESLCKDICTSFGGLLDNIMGLGSAGFIPGDKTYAAINMAKNSFVNKAVSCLAIRAPADAGEYASLASFKDSARSSLDSVRNAAPKQAFFISKYFKGHADAIIEGMKSADAALSRLSSFLASEGMLLEHVANARNTLARLAEAERAVAASAGDLRRSEERLAFLSSELASRKEKLESFTRSGEWKSHSDGTERLGRIESRMVLMEQEANRMLSVLHRPMKKLSHGRGGAVLPENPFREFVLPGKDLSVIVAELTEAARSGEITLKASERDKIALLADSAGRVGEIKEAYREASAEYGLLLASMDAGVQERRAALEKELMGAETKKKAVEDEIDEIRREIQKRREERHARAAEAGSAVQKAAGREVRIIVQESPLQA